MQAKRENPSSSHDCLCLQFRQTSPNDANWFLNGSLDYSVVTRRNTIKSVGWIWHHDWRVLNVYLEQHLRQATVPQHLDPKWASLAISEILETVTHPGIGLIPPLARLIYSYVQFEAWVIYSVGKNQFAGFPPSFAMHEFFLEEGGGEVTASQKRQHWFTNSKSIYPNHVFKMLRVLLP